MNAADHVGERLVDFVDGRLTPADEDEVRSHLAECPDCERDRRLLEAGRTAAGVLAQTVELPPGLARSIAAGLDEIDRASAAHRGARARLRWLGLAAAATLAGVAALAWFRPWQPTVPAEARAQFDRVDREGLPPDALRASAPLIERYFADRAGPGLRVRVIDLAMMGWQVEGGAVVRLANRPAALYSYLNGVGQRLICQMFEGTTAELPPTRDVRSSRGFEFHVYRENDVTLVFWQEGHIVCVLASRLPPDAVAALAFEKAMRPS